MHEKVQEPEPEAVQEAEVVEILESEKNSCGEVDAILSNHDK